MTPLSATVSLSLRCETFAPLHARPDDELHQASRDLSAPRVGRAGAAPLERPAGMAPPALLVLPAPLPPARMHACWHSRDTRSRYAAGSREKILCVLSCSRARSLPLSPCVSLIHRIPRQASTARRDRGEYPGLNSARVASRATPGSKDPRASRVLLALSGPQGVSCVSCVVV